jgi:hypothetical protein
LQTTIVPTTATARFIGRAATIFLFRFPALGFLLGSCTQDLHLLWWINPHQLVLMTITIHLLVTQSRKEGSHILVERIKFEAFLQTSSRLVSIFQIDMCHSKAVERLHSDVLGRRQH